MSSRQPATHSLGLCARPKRQRNSAACASVRPSVRANTRYVRARGARIRGCCRTQRAHPNTCRAPALVARVNAHRPVVGTSLSLQLGTAGKRHPIVRPGIDGTTAWFILWRVPARVGDTTVSAAVSDVVRPCIGRWAGARSTSAGCAARADCAARAACDRASVVSGYCVRGALARHRNHQDAQGPSRTNRQNPHGVHQLVVGRHRDRAPEGRAASWSR
jgi:hypothetical protein